MMMSMTMIIMTTIMPGPMKTTMKSADLTNRGPAAL